MNRTVAVLFLVVAVGPAVAQEKPIGKGDVIVVTAERANVMSGRKVVVRVAKGKRLQVSRVHADKAVTRMEWSNAIRRRVLLQGW